MSCNVNEHSRHHDQEGRYANSFNVGFNALEFVIEFAQLYEESTEPIVHTRIITSPHYAKGLVDLLGVAIADYNAKYGAIQPGQ
jgi:hypothetical protein